MHPQDSAAHCDRQDNGDGEDNIAPSFPQGALMGIAGTPVWLVIQNDLS